MKLVLTVALATLGIMSCVRSDLSDTRGIDCAPGALVVVANAPFCVYPDDLPETCPEAVPFPLTDGELFYCAIEAQPPGELVRAARAVYEADTKDGGALDPADGGPPDFSNRPDSGRIFDAAPVPDASNNARDF
jgi:hypothetical protein